MASGKEHLKYKHRSLPCGFNLGGGCGLESKFAARLFGEVNRHKKKALKGVLVSNLYHSDIAIFYIQHIYLDF